MRGHCIVHYSVFRPQFDLLRTRNAAPVAGRHMRWKPIPSKEVRRRSRGVAPGDGRARTCARASRGSSSRDHEPRRSIGEGERRRCGGRICHRADRPPPGRWRASLACRLLSERPRRRQFRLGRSGVAATACRQAARRISIRIRHPQWKARHPRSGDCTASPPARIAGSLPNGYWVGLVARARLTRRNLWGSSLAWPGLGARSKSRAERDRRPLHQGNLQMTS